MKIFGGRPPTTANFENATTAAGPPKTGKITKILAVVGGRRRASATTANFFGGCRPRRARGRPADFRRATARPPRSSAVAIFAFFFSWRSSAGARVGRRPPRNWRTLRGPAAVVGGRPAVVGGPAADFFQFGGRGLLAQIISINKNIRLRVAK